MIGKIDFNQVFVGIILGWTTLGIFVMVISNWPKKNIGEILPPKPWPRPKEKRKKNE